MRADLQSPSQANLLLVDDRPENLLALAAILEPLGQNLVQAHSGVEALKYLLAYDFAVILMDVQMPGLDGFETAALIKQRERSRHIPIIFVTAISKDERYVFQGYEAGAVDYIFKPFQPDILKSKVAVFIDLFRKGEEIKRQAALLRENERRQKELEMRELERALERRRLDELAASEAKLNEFKMTLDAALDCISIFDSKTLHFTYLNQGAFNQLGYETCDELLSMTPVDIEPECDEPRFRALLEPLIQGERASIMFETVHRRKDGSDVPVEVFLQFIAPPAQEPRFVAIVRDITERKRVEQSLILAKEQAERANRAKSDFISSISHELRTPLNAIIGFSKLMLNPRVGPLNEDQTAYMQDVVQSADHLLQLINDILDISKIEAGKMAVELMPFCLVELLEHSLGIIREKAKQHDLKIATAFAPEVVELPPVVADQRKIKQVMYNLLSNAAKFTPAGGSITVHAACEGNSCAAPGSNVIISVEDTGIGIAPDHQARIFGAFEQVDTSYERQQQGTGLGLTLTKQIVEMHGGRVWLTSTPGVGSTFSFSLPLLLSEAGSAAAPLEEMAIA
ncbi:MAG TPA: ATP-binding protein [Abditibacteriaceae bacterium]|nr:ATP-binding protein [Abditibacteriaceae bacterium]